jgi:hypothetical protein
VLRTKRIRLTRSIFLNGEHAEAGSVHDMSRALADDLIAQGSAVQVNFVSRFFSRIWFFVSRRTKREEVSAARGPLRKFVQEDKMDRKEKALELLDRAGKLGLRVGFDSGLNIVKLSETDDSEKQHDIIEELAKYLPEVRAISQRRAVAALGKTLAGRRIWSRESGEGTLVGASDDGTLCILIGVEVRTSDQEEAVRRSHSITCNAEDLLILLDEEEADGASSPHNDETKSEQPRKGIFQRLRGSRED